MSARKKRGIEQISPQTEYQPFDDNDTAMYATNSKRAHVPFVFDIFFACCDISFRPSSTISHSPLSASRNELSAKQEPMHVTHQFIDNQPFFPQVRPPLRFGEFDYPDPTLPDLPVAYRHYYDINRTLGGLHEERSHRMATSDPFR
jgi:hypothetical protein